MISKVSITCRTQFICQDPHQKSNLWGRARIDGFATTGDVTMYDLRKQQIKEGLYFILEDVGHCKSKHYMQNTIFVIMAIIK